MMLAVDASLASQTDFLILLLCELLLIHLLQFLYLPVCILLQLSQRLMMLLESLFLHFNDPVTLVPIGPLLLLELHTHLIDHAIMAMNKLPMLSLPFLLLSVKVLSKLLEPLHFHKHFLLKRLLELLRLLLMGFLQVLDIFLVLHSHLSLLFTEDLVLAAFRLDLLTVLLLKLSHLLLVVTVTMPQ